MASDPQSDSPESSRGQKTVESTPDSSNKSSRGRNTVESASSLTRFWAELRQRKVMRVALAYGAVGWLSIEVSATVFPYLGIPEWLVTALIILVILGFPVSLVLSWIYDLTPQGIRNTDTFREERAEASGQDTKRMAQPALVLFIAAAVPTLIFGAATLYFFLKAKTATDELIIVTETQFEGIEEKSIAVLPFENRSELTDDAFFTDGIHDELLTRISKISDIKTTSRTSVEVYRDSPKNMKTIGEELGVATILEGGVQRAGDQIRINVQLIDAATDAHLWAEIYTREMSVENVFDIQTEICRSIADALKAVISPEEQKRIEKIPTENFKALEAFFRGREIYESGIQTRKPEAVRLLEQAVELDSEFTLAHVYLCWAGPLWYAGASDKRPIEERLSEAEPIAKRALELDPELPEVHLLWADIYNLRANVTGNREINHALQKKSIERAIELDPNSAHAKRRYGQFLTRGYGGRSYTDQLVARRTALPWIQKAADLDPRNSVIITNLGYQLEVFGEFQDARKQYETAIQINPSNSGVHRRLGFLLMIGFGRYDEAIPILRQAVEMDPLRWEPKMFLSVCYEVLGDNKEALRWIKTASVSSWGSNPQDRIDKYTLSVNDREKWLEQVRLGFHELSVLIYRPRRYLLNDDVRDGRAAEALERYKSAFPFLFEEGFQAKVRPELNQIDRFNSMFVEDQALLATELAEILLQLGKAEEARPLLDAGWEAFKEFPRMGWWGTGYRRGYGIRDVVYYALLGKKREALSALRVAIDAGFRDRTELESSALDSLHGEPEFIAMMEQVKAEWARQLANVRRMEANGELARIPDIIREAMEEK